MADFIDYNAYAEANAPEEERLLADAYARAEAADQKARGALSKSRNEASGSYDERGQIVGGMDDITKTGSFSDFLKFQQEAEVSRLRAQQAFGEDPRRQALRRDMSKRSGTSDRLDAMGKSLDGQAAVASNSVREGAAGRERLRAEDTERRRLAEEQRTNDAATQRGFREAFNTDLSDRLKAFSDRGPAVGFGQQQANELSYLWQTAGRNAGSDSSGRLGREMKGLDERFKGANANRNGYTFRVNNYNKGGY